MSKIFFLVLFPVLLFGATDAEKVAQALEDRLSDALEFDSGLDNNVHPQTKLRRFEDGNPMWLQFFVRPGQNRLFPNYYGKGFQTGQYESFYSSISNISNSKAFQMYHSSPWSYKFSGIGKLYFYRKANFKERFYRKTSTNDRPILHTFGSSDNGILCLCSHAYATCDPKYCGHRETIGSVKFCPGVATYQGSNYVGQANLYSKCNPRPRGSYCFENISGEKSRLRSFHFDALIDRVYFYRDRDCKGTNSWYSYQKQHGTVSQISSHVQNKVRSIKIIFKDSRFDY